MQPDFLTNVETAFLTIFEANTVLAQYAWQRWDDDTEIEIPRGVLMLSATRDPQESPYHHVQVNVRFEGRPKKPGLTEVMNELKSVLATINDADLDTASGGTVKFLGKAINVVESRMVESGLRVWSFSFCIYALPMV